MNCRWDFFYRAERRATSAHPKDVPARELCVDLPRDWSLAQALEYVYAAGMMPRGSHRSGCFEVQNSVGIWQHVEGNKIDLSTERKATNVSFKTWEQLEAEELAERAAA